MSKKLRKYQKINNRSLDFNAKAAVTFYKWLAKNRGKFNHRPIQISKYKFRFEGVIKNIVLTMDLSMPEAMLAFYDDKGKYFDHLSIEYIGDEQYDPSKGYYDADREDKKYDYFPSLKELWIHNVFDVIPRFCNENFTSKHWLYLNSSSTSSSALIRPKGYKVDSNSEGWTTKVYDMLENV